MTEAPALFPYQKVGAEWLASRKTALLADSMGLGKSAQAITACDLINAQSILVLCPAVARINWVREFEKFSTIARKFQIIDSRDIALESKCVVVSYDLAEDLNRALTIAHFDVLILDECHFLKSIQSKRSKSVLGKEGLVRKACRTWALSGTPAPNHPGELWPLLYTFGAVNVTYETYVKKYCTYYFFDRYRMQITGAKKENIPELRETLSKVMLRRKKEDVMSQLPPLRYGYLTVEPGPVDLEKEASFFQYVFPEDRRKELFEQLNSEKKLLETAMLKTRFGDDGLKTLEALAPSIATLRRYTGIQKVKHTAEIIAQELEMEEGIEKIVIFAIHRDVIEGLRVKLHRFGPVTLYGNTPTWKRQSNIDRFQTNPKCRVFIGNIQAAGCAINLTAASNVVFVEQSWVPGDNAQAMMRVHRIGQTEKVLVRFVGLNNSIDQKIAQVLKKKTDELTKIFDEERDLSSENFNDTTLDVPDEDIFEGL